MDLYLMGTYRFDKGKPGYPFSTALGESAPAAYGCPAVIWEDNASVTSDGGVAEGAPSRYETKPVPQPFLASLFLRNTWLLLGFWNHDRLFRIGGEKAEAGEGKPKLGIRHSVAPCSCTRWATKA